MKIKNPIALIGFVLCFGIFAAVDLLWPSNPLAEFSAQIRGTLAEKIQEPAPDVITPTTVTE